jgi:hypothetical protein
MKIRGSDGMDRKQEHFEKNPKEPFPPDCSRGFI